MTDATPRVVVVDYGLGNLKSVTGALERAGAAAEVSDSPEAFATADGLVLPGVGAFGRGVANLAPIRSGLRAAIEGGTPTLGICLGLQLLLSTSEEAPDAEGLGLIPGTSVRFDGEAKVPHMGWNEIEVVREHPLVADIDRGHAYFVHSYYPVPDDETTIVATTEYDVTFGSVLATDDTVFGTQFHPEKSGEVGLQLLRNFVSICASTPRDRHNG